jgi:MOSC domain-containing protein YiiM
LYSNDYKKQEPAGTEKKFTDLFKSKVHQITALFTDFPGGNHAKNRIIHPGPEIRRVPDSVTHEGHALYQ